MFGRLPTGDDFALKRGNFAGVISALLFLGLAALSTASAPGSDPNPAQVFVTGFVERPGPVVLTSKFDHFVQFP
jgi:hypothetical protein